MRVGDVALIGSVSWVMVSFVGIDGVRILSNLGGLPSMVIVLLSTSALWIWIRDPALLSPPAEAKRKEAVRAPG